MTAAAPPRPVRAAPLPSGELAVAWSDGHESFYPGKPLRCACTCAACVDEGTGAKVLRDESVPEDVHPTEIHPVGNYGLAIRWSDDHDTGIYTFELLRALCPCEACSG